MRESQVAGLPPSSANHGLTPTPTEKAMELELVIKALSAAAYIWLGCHHLKHRERIPGACYLALAGCGMAHIAGF